MEASVAIAMAVDAIFMCLNACGYVERSQQQLLELGKKKKERERGREGDTLASVVNVFTKVSVSILLFRSDSLCQSFFYPIIFFLSLPPVYIHPPSSLSSNLFTIFQLFFLSSSLLSFFHLHSFLSIFFTYCTHLHLNLYTYASPVFCLSIHPS